MLTVSAQADKAKEAGDPAGEKAFAQEALKLIEEGPEGCLDGSDDGNEGEAGRKQQEPRTSSRSRPARSSRTTAVARTEEG